jgi:hypothetical protein
VIRLLGATVASTALLGIGAAPPPVDEPAAPRIIAARAPVVVVSTYQGRTAKQWAGRYRHAVRRLQGLQRVLLHKPTVVEAINLACATYGNCGTLWSLAQCESRLNPHARNLSSASGLFQIMHPSTWRTTPYAPFDVYSPYANALAAGYMVSHGRRGEWVC